MSLTALLKDSFGKEFRERLRRDFPSPKFEMGTGIIAVPDETIDHQISGTAYDYVIRFALERITPKNKIIERGWVAERGYKALMEELKKKTATKIMAHGGNTIYDVKELRLFLKGRFDQAVQDYKKFLAVKGKKIDYMIDQEMISSCVFLAKLDLFVRKHIIHPGFYLEDTDIAIDVRLMYKMTDLKCFQAEKKCYLNPSMGSGCFVGASDADLVIDDTLIDLKTTRKDKLQRRDFNQLLGYYILSLISGLNMEPKHKPIKKVGIYFARFGVLWTIPIKEIGSKQKFEDVKKYLLEYPPYVEMMKNINDTSKYEKLTSNTLQNG